MVPLGSDGWSPIEAVPAVSDLPSASNVGLGEIHLRSEHKVAYRVGGSEMKDMYTLSRGCVVAEDKIPIAISVILA